MLAKPHVSASLILALGMGMSSSQAQEKKTPEPATFWDKRQNMQAGAAAQVVLARNPITAFVLRMEGRRWVVWQEPEFLGDTAPALDPKWLDLIRDRTPMPDLRGKAKDEIRPDQWAAREVFVEAILHASQTPLEAFKKSAEENSHITFAHLINEQKLNRGKVVKVEGQLARLRKIDFVPGKLQEAGIKFIYEGYVFGPTAKSNPFYIQFVQAPDGLKEAEKMDQWVTFYGYFLKLTRYIDGKGKERDTPLLIGPTVVLRHPPPKSGGNGAMPESLVYGIVGFAAFMVVFLVGLNLWFRRGDRRFRNQVADIHAKSALEAMASAEQGLLPDKEEHIMVADPTLMTDNGTRPRND